MVVVLTRMGCIVNYLYYLVGIGSLLQSLTQSKDSKTLFGVSATFYKDEYKVVVGKTTF